MMLRLAADENFNNNIVRGALRVRPELDFVRVQDVGLSSSSDEAVLAWAAIERRILCTHDVATLPKLAHERVLRGEPMPGVLAAPVDISVSAAIADLLLIAECSEPDDWRDQVHFLPLR